MRKKAKLASEFDMKNQNYLLAFEFDKKNQDQLLSPQHELSKFDSTVLTSSDIAWKKCQVFFQ